MDKIGQAQDKLIPLGKKIDYSSIYAPHILYPIPRRTPVQILEQNPRQKESDIITYKDEPSLYGYDIWNCYEVSFRNSKYIPQVRILEIYIPCNSPNLIESKSLKLYLFSLSDLVASSDEEFLEIVRNDLELIAGAKIFLKLKKLYELEEEKLHTPEGVSIDELEINLKDFNYNQRDILFDNNFTEEVLFSNLYRSNCPITNQPDWATIIIKYKGNKINRESLLKYIISHRNENMFHENSVEGLFTKIYSSKNFEKLCVYARYTRRGGIDINPIRANYEIAVSEILNHRLARQ